MKKILSLVLSAIMVLSALCITTAADDGTPSSLALTDVISVTGAEVSYDEGAKALKISPDDSGSVNVEFNSDGSMIALWVPYGFDNAVNANVGTINPSHKFSAYSFSGTLSFTGDVPVYASVTGNDESAVLSLANGSLNGYTEEELTLDSYDVEKYTRYYWEGEIVYNESFFALSDEDGTFSPITMAYDIDRVVSVRNSYLNVEYKYGVDYVIEDGKLIILPETSMLTYTYDKVYSKTNTSWRKTLEGTYEYCGQQPMFLYGYFNITYTTTDTWEGVIPEAKSFLLPKTVAKLNNGEDLRILSLGDSISGGANASISANVPPYSEVWHNMTVSALREKYPESDIYHNVIAQGGATAAFAITKMNDILAYRPDLVMIEFGVNECMQGDGAFDKDGYVDTVISAISAIKENLPDCEIILVGVTISNTHFFPDEWFWDYATSNYFMETEGVAFADVAGTYQYLLTRKRGIDIIGDNLCHPNDFSMRILAQTVLRTLETATEEEYIEGLSERMLKLRYEEFYRPEEWQQIVDAEQQASNRILGAADAEEAIDIYFEEAQSIAEIPTAREYEKSQKIDYMNLVFNSGRSVDAITSTYSSTPLYDEELNCLVVTTTNTRNTSFTIDYRNTEVYNAVDKVNYAVVTAAVSPESSTRSTASSVAFYSNGSEESLGADKITHITRDGVFHSYIIDLTGKEGKENTIDKLEFIVFSSSKIGDVLYVDSIILCETQRDADSAAADRTFIANKNLASAITYLVDSEDAAGMFDASTGEGRAMILGDANADGKLNSLDILILRKYVAEMPVEVTDFEAMDIDRDGDYTPADVLKLRQTLAGILPVDVEDSSSAASVEYSSAKDSAKITAKVDSPVLKVDLSGEEISGDVYKYVTLTAMSEKGEEFTVNVTVENTDGETVSDVITVAEGDAFSATTAKLPEISGNIKIVTFEVNVEGGNIVYFDSVVLTPTYEAAKNAELVREGAANLI